MKRSAYFDNAKAILIYFVVLGHLLSSYLLKNDLLDTFYFVIYLFHMPAFILISGHFSKKLKTWHDFKKMIQTLFIPYIIFQFIYTFYYKEFFNDPIEFALFEPRYALWFLLSMMLWRLLLTVIAWNKYMVIASIIASLYLGSVGEVTEWFSLSRTFFFFPFFLLGYYINRQSFMKLKNKWNKCFAFVAIPVVFMFCYQVADIRWREWFLGRIPYDEIHYGILDSAVLSRLVAYCFMLIATYIFLSLVPVAKRFYTSVGEKTLGVYLLHLFFIRAFKETVLFEWIAQTGNYMILVFIAFCIVYVLSNKYVWRVTKPILTTKFK